MERGFSEEGDLFRESIRKFVKREILPRAREIGTLEEVPRDLWRKICEMGLVGMTAPEQYGGQPGHSHILGIGAEEIGKGDVSLAATLVPNIAFCILLQQGSAAVQKKWLPPVIQGEKLCCVAVTEPECGTDVAAMKTTARRKGVSCFLLPLDSPGIRRSAVADMGLKPITRATFTLKDVPIPSEYLIGGEGEGLSMIMKSFDLMRVLVALISIGAAEAVLEETIGYVKERAAFGRPIGTFEGVSFKIAEGKTLLEAARALCYRALSLRDRGAKHTKEAAMSKWWSTKVAVEVIHDALVLHGRFGYSSEALIEQRLRDVIGNQLADGSPEAMKLILVRELLGKEFLPYQ